MWRARQKRTWDVLNFKGKLPPEFCLREDEDFVYLFYKEKQVAIFSSIGVNPEAIEERAENYLQSIEEET